MVQFIPEKPKAPELNVPYYEDNLQDKLVPGRGVHKPVEYYQNQIKDLLLKLGAGAVSFPAGTYPTSPTPRYGYQIQFSLNGIPGRIDCAALPLRSETAYRKDRALAQALFLVRTWLEGELYSTIYRPGSIPLVQYLIGAGDKTVTEMLVEKQMLPDMWHNGKALPSGG
jgi:hypothetical protein